MKRRTSSMRGRRRAAGAIGACAALLLLQAGAGCARFVDVHRTDLLKERRIRRIAVMPFGRDLYVERHQAKREPIVTCLIDGRRFTGGTVPESAPLQVTAAFVQQLTTRGGYTLVLPGETEAYIARKKLDPVALAPGPFFQAVGTGLGADAVLAGNVLRYDELHGSAYGAERPASIAIDVHLMDARTGALLWEATYEEAQAALSDNLGSFGTVVQRGAKFLTASQLATWAVEQILKEFPRPEETGKDAGAGAAAAAGEAPP